MPQYNRNFTKKQEFAYKCRKQPQFRELRLQPQQVYNGGAREG